MTFKPYFLLIIVLAVACKATPEHKTTITKSDSDKITAQQITTVLPKETTSVDSSKIVPIDSFPPQTLAKLIIDDESAYSEYFIDRLRRIEGMNTVNLQQGKMILNEQDTISFPDIPTLNRRIKFTAKQEDLALALSVKRINYTSIEYDIEMVESGKSSHYKNGIAHLNELFFLGSESRVHDLTGENFFTTDYHSQKDSCYLSISIGNIEDTPNKALLAKIIKNCNNQIKDIALDNYSILIEK